MTTDNPWAWAAEQRRPQPSPAERFRILVAEYPHALDDLAQQGARQLSEAEQFRSEAAALIQSLHATATELRGKLSARGQWPAAAIVANAADLAGACLVAIGRAAEHLEV